MVLLILPRRRCLIFLKKKKKEEKSWGITAIDFLVVQRGRSPNRKSKREINPWNIAGPAKQFKQSK